MSVKTNRLYGELAWLWPLWSDPSEYAPYCDRVVQLIQENTRRKMHSLLNMGCGGGKNAYNLKQHFTVTGIDLSARMLDLARQLNPECRFLQADMRAFSLGERFDAILIDDAISYMTTEADLRAVFSMAESHLQPGGVMVCGPDSITETFVQNTTRVSHAAASVKPEEVEVVFIENDYDPDPQDTVYEATILYLIRDHGEFRVEQDLHLLGLFPLDTWRRLLREVGFELHEAVYTENERAFIEFACVKLPTDDPAG